MRRPRVPLFIVCANPACERVHQVRDRYHQRRTKHCSHACAGAMRKGRRAKAAQRQACRQVGLAWGRRRREAAIERLKAKTPVQAFRLGYERGFQSAKRQIISQYILTPRRKDAAA